MTTETKNSAAPDKGPLNGNSKSARDSDWLGLVERQVNALKFGSVVITVHEGRVVQVETSVRVRFEK